MLWNCLLFHLFSIVLTYLFPVTTYPLDSSEYSVSFTRVCYTTWQVEKFSVFYKVSNKLLKMLQVLIYFTYSKLEECDDIVVFVLTACASVYIYDYIDVG